MSASIIAVVTAIGAIALSWFVLKRMVRMAIRLAIVGLMLLALLAGGIVWWWNGGTGGHDGPTRESRPNTTRRGNTR